jgi:signal transduction histidine kinase
MAGLTDRDRLAALGESELLDRPSNATLDRYTRLAKLALDVPIAFVSLVDGERQFFTSQVGLEGSLAIARETSLSYSFCQHVGLDERPLVVADARSDPRLAANPSVSEHSVIAYAGMPIRTSDGHVLGSLCAIETRPRQWSERDLNVLAELALAVGAEIDTVRRAVRAERSQQRLVEAVEHHEALQTQAAQSARQTTHDLRTPLQVIAMGIEGLRGFVTSTTAAGAMRILDALERNTRHAVEIVGALHDMGNIPDATERVDLGTLAALVCKDLQLRDRAITIEVINDGASFAVAASTRELQRCVENLVTNAQRFAATRIVVRVVAANGSAELVVEDDGQGLPTLEDYGRAFSARVRFHAAEGKSGTGLGLASVRAMIEWCGGRVIARRSHLGGAAFGFSLPLAATDG